MTLLLMRPPAGSPDHEPDCEGLHAPGAQADAQSLSHPHTPATRPCGRIIGPQHRSRSKCCQLCRRSPPKRPPADNPVSRGGSHEWRTRVIPSPTASMTSRRHIRSVCYGSRSGGSSNGPLDRQSAGDGALMFSLCTYVQNGEERVGMVLGDSMTDLNESLSPSFAPVPSSAGHLYAHRARPLG
jgi:hypothetical protein